MSRRLVSAVCRSSRLCWLPCLALLAHAGPAFAQDAPSAPGVPAPPPEAAPPAPEAPTAAPSAPAPPSQAPVTAEPAPTPAAPVLEPPPAPKSNAAFEPLPESPAPPPKRKPRATSRSASAPVSEPAASGAPAAAVPPASAVAPAAAAPRDVSHVDYEAGKDTDDDHYGGPFAPFRLGVLAGGGLPEIVSLGGQLKLTRFFGAGVNIGLIPTVKIAYYGDATLSYQEYDAYGHIYPFGGAFFLGAGVGYATIHGTLASKFNLSPVQAMYPGVAIPASVDVSSEGQVRTLVLTPQLGFLKVFDVGFAIGIDVGAQIPIAPSKVEFSTAAPGLPEPIASAVQTKYINPNDEKVRSTLDKIGRTPLPTFGIKIGWFL